MDFSVVILATGTTATGSLVHAIAVTQPVQSWTVLRSHSDFVAVGKALTPVLDGLPACPEPLEYNGDMNTIVTARNDMQGWLTNILMYPGARESPEVQNFLTYAANMMPPEFEGVQWVNFTAPQQPPQSAAQPQANLAAVDTAAATAAAAAVAAAAAAVSSNNSSAQPGNNGDVDELEMEYMFAPDEDMPVDDYSDDDEEYSASARYKPTDEPISRQDEMEFLQPGDVMMVEDLGSLAQSMGASHLGRSLQLQKEMEGKGPGIGKSLSKDLKETPSVGLRIGGAPVPAGRGTGANGSFIGGGGGGIGGAMEKALETASAGGIDLSRENAPMKQQLLSPPKLESFKMMKVIGKGSFGKVFLVKERKTGDVYALKVLRKDNIIKRNQVEHTRTERSVLGYVQHPFIVGMKMAFQSKDKLYFVLDFCAGGELFFHLGRLGKFPEHQSRFYASEIILAISYVHSLDIIYRDLKPENVLLDARGHVRLTDFGLSKEGISSSSSGANSFCGTPEYLAPEILNRQGHGRAVDWWSLGALLYEMLTGLPPFYCQDREKIFEKIRKSDLHYPPSLSKQSKTLLRGLLTRDPNSRLGSGPGDAEEIKIHEFFAEIDWDKLATGEMTPPWKPPISGKLDTSHFDKEFTSLPIFSPQSMQRTHGFGSTPQNNLFDGFTFTNRTFGLHGPGGGGGIGSASEAQG